MLASLQIILAIALIASVGLWRRSQAKRDQRSWDDIVSDLCASDWGIQEISERYLYRSEITATPTDIWKRIGGVHGLRAMFKNASLLVQLADFAAEDCGYRDLALLQELRGDAFQIRLSAFAALATHLMFHSNAAADSAFKATTVYSSMLARLTAALEENAGQLFPAYLEVM